MLEHDNKNDWEIELKSKHYNVNVLKRVVLPFVKGSNGEANTGLEAALAVSNEGIVFVAFFVIDDNLRRWVYKYDYKKDEFKRIPINENKYFITNRSSNIIVNNKDKTFLFAGSYIDKSTAEAIKTSGFNNAIYGSFFKSNFATGIFLYEYDYVNDSVAETKMVPFSQEFIKECAISDDKYDEQKVVPAWLVFDYMQRLGPQTYFVAVHSFGGLGGGIVTGSAVLGNMNGVIEKHLNLSAEDFMYPAMSKYTRCMAATEQVPGQAFENDIFCFLIGPDGIIQYKIFQRHISNNGCYYIKKGEDTISLFYTYYYTGDDKAHLNQVRRKGIDPEKVYEVKITVNGIVAEP